MRPDRQSVYARRMTSLRPCESCGRHVRTAAERCPFCDVAMGASAPAPVRRFPLSGLTRAALFAGAAALLAPACGGRDEPETIAQPYGAPPDPEGGDEDPGTGEEGTGEGGQGNAEGPEGNGTPDHAIAPPYGTPPAREPPV